MVWKKFYKKGKKEEEKDNNKDEGNNTLVNAKNLKPIEKKSNEKIYIMPLGGIGEVGKNLTLFQCRDEIVILDVGFTFPTEDMLGVDLVIPDFSYIESNKDKIKGIALTHGHLDHIGALPYLYKKIDNKIPMLGSKLTMELVKSKFKENNDISKFNFREVQNRSKIRIGKYFELEFIRVTHSIADAFAVAIHTPSGTILHTGDFKVDLTPVDKKPMDFYKLAQLGENGVLLLLSDSTNAEREGTTPPEKGVGDSIKESFDKAKGRIVIASFSSHIHRLQQIINVTHAAGRKFAVEGRSMKEMVKIASDMGYLKIPEGTKVDLRKIKNLKSEEVVLLCTGTQGEPMAALSRMANGEHRHIEIREKDTVIISATPIPGNEKSVYRNINKLLKTKAEVIYEKGAGIHVSGHGSQEDLKLMLSLVKPKFFIPVHGEFKHMKKHKDLAMEMGMKEDNILLLDKNGIRVKLTEDELKLDGKVPFGETLIDGLGIGDVGNIVLKDRQQLSEDGILVVIVTIDGKTGKILSGPDLITRGFVYARNSETLIRNAKKRITDDLKKLESNNVTDWNTLKRSIRSSISNFLYKETRRNPMILPVITEG
ncbi:MAG: ribonuclease J [Fusobacteriota bacterium]